MVTRKIQKEEIRAAPILQKPLQLHPHLDKPGIRKPLDLKRPNLGGSQNLPQSLDVGVR